MLAICGSSMSPEGLIKHQYSCCSSVVLLPLLLQTFWMHDCVTQHENAPRKGQQQRQGGQLEGSIPARHPVGQRPQAAAGADLLSGVRSSVLQ